MQQIIDSALVPQQDDLGKVRALVRALHDGVPRPELGDAAGLSSRHVRYTFHAARALGLTRLDGDSWSLTSAADGLLDVDANSDAEREFLRRSVKSSPTLMALVPELLDDTPLELEALGRRLVSRCGLSASTAVRRAMTLLAWRDALAVQEPVVEDDEEEEIAEIVVVPEPGYGGAFVNNPVDDQGQILMF